MTTERDVNRIVRSWMDEGVTALPDYVLDAVLDQLPATPQRRATWWRVQRYFEMNKSVAFGLVAAVTILVLALIGLNLGPGSGPPPGGEPSITPATPTASPIPLPPSESSLDAGTYRTTPFAGLNAPGVCEGQVGCTEAPADDSIAFTVTVPDGWSVSGLDGIWADSNAPPDGAMLIFYRGGWLYEDPCSATGLPSVAVGPTADDFAAALADHPLLDATEPVDVTLGGYTGKYVDITAPSDLDQCVGEYRLWDPGVYAQGPDHRWHLWILDVEGIRVVVQTMDYPGTSVDRQAELQAMVDSIEITP